MTRRKMKPRRIPCPVCNELKLVDDFYPYANPCKECVKARVRSNRKQNIEYYREYDRQRANDPKRVAARKAYQQTEQGRERANAAKHRYIERNRDKRLAHNAVSNALRDNKLIRQPCEGCGTTTMVEAHHEDYSKPLDVRWLCDPCHKAVHNELREQERADA